MNNQNDHYIWYACYGSNINQDRFTLYIKGGSQLFFGVEVSNPGCQDSSLPIQDLPFHFNHPIYFAKSENRWNGGVAFLDPSRLGLAYGRAYLITESQFLEVKKQEGSWYDQTVSLGFLKGYPVKTFTGYHTDLAIPSVSYLSTIKAGLRQIGMSEKKINEYISAIQIKKT